MVLDRSKKQQIACRSLQSIAISQSKFAPKKSGKFISLAGQRTSAPFCIRKGLSMVKVSRKKLRRSTLSIEAANWLREVAFFLKATLQSCFHTTHVVGNKTARYPKLIEIAIFDMIFQTVIPPFPHCCAGTPWQFSAPKDVLMGTTTFQWHTTLPFHWTSFGCGTWCRDGKLMAIPWPMSRQKVSHAIPRYIFRCRDIQRRYDISRSISVNLDPWHWEQPAELWNDFFAVC